MVRHPWCAFPQSVNSLHSTVALHKPEDEKEMSTWGVSTEIVQEANTRQEAATDTHEARREGIFRRWTGYLELTACCAQKYFWYCSS